MHWNTVRSSKLPYIVGVSAAFASAMIWSSAFAQTSPINSYANDIQVQVNILNTLDGTIGPYTSASGYEDPAQPTYQDSQTFLTAAASGQATTIGLVPSVTGLTLSSGTLSSSASGGTNPIHVTASADVENLGLTLKEAGIVPLIKLRGTNNDIQSQSDAYVIAGVDSVSGSSSIAGLTLDVLGVAVDLSAYQNAAPNTKVILTGLAAALTGLDITVNKQTVVSTSQTLSILTDAIDIDFNDLSLGGSVPINTVASGDIILSQSFAQVPEPATWVELLLGFAALGGLVRGRRRLLPSVV